MNISIFQFYVPSDVPRELMSCDKISAGLSSLESTGCKVQDEM